MPLRHMLGQARPDPLTLALSPSDGGEAIGSPAPSPSLGAGGVRVRAGSSMPPRHMLRQARPDPLTLTLSPADGGEGIRLRAAASEDGRWERGLDVVGDAFADRTLHGLGGNVDLGLRVEGVQ